MSAMSVLTPITAVAVVLAWSLVRGWWTRARWPFHRPVAALLTLFLVSDLARAWVQSDFLSGEARPFAWPTRLAFLVDSALFIAWPCGTLATCLASLRKRSPAWALIPWVAASASIAWCYPWLRQERLALFYACLWTVLWVASALVALRPLRRDVWLAHHATVALVILGDLAISAWMWSGPDWMSRWGEARSLYVAPTMAIVLCHIHKMWRNRRSA